MVIKIRDKVFIAFFIYVFYSFINSLYSSFTMNPHVFTFVIVFSLLPIPIYLVYKDIRKSTVWFSKAEEYDDYPSTLKPEMLSTPIINRNDFIKNLMFTVLVGVLVGASLILPALFQSLKLTHDYILGSTYHKNITVFDSGCDYQHKLGVRCFVMAKHEDSNLKLFVSKAVIDDIKGKSVKLKYKGSAIGTSITHYQIIAD